MPDAVKEVITHITLPDSVNEIFTDTSKPDSVKQVTTDITKLDSGKEVTTNTSKPDAAEEVTTEEVSTDTTFVNERTGTATADTSVVPAGPSMKESSSSTSKPIEATAPSIINDISESTGTTNAATFVVASTTTATSVVASVCPPDMQGFVEFKYPFLGGTLIEQATNGLCYGQEKNVLASNQIMKLQEEK
jgi:hypothetical protein